MFNISIIQKYIFSLLSSEDIKEIQSIYKKYFEIKNEMNTNDNLNENQTRLFLDEVRKTDSFTIYNNSHGPYFYKEYKIKDKDIEFVFQGSSYLDEKCKIKIGKNNCLTYILLTLEFNNEANKFDNTIIEFSNFAFLTKKERTKKEDLSLIYEQNKENNFNLHLIENQNYIFLENELFINFLNTVSDVNSKEIIKKSIQEYADLEYIKTDKKPDLNYYYSIVDEIKKIADAAIEYQNKNGLKNDKFKTT